MSSFFEGRGRPDEVVGLDVSEEVAEADFISEERVEVKATLLELEISLVFVRDLGRWP